MLNCWGVIWQVMSIGWFLVELTCRIEANTHEVSGAQSQGPAGYLVISFTRLSWMVRMVSSRKSTGWSELLQEWWRETFLFETPGHTEQVFVAFLRSAPLQQSCVWGLWAVPSTSWFCVSSDMHCQLSELVYTDGYMSVQITSALLNLPQVDWTPTRDTFQTWSREMWGSWVPYSIQCYASKMISPILLF